MSRLLTLFLRCAALVLPPPSLHFSHPTLNAQPPPRIIPIGITVCGSSTTGRAHGMITFPPNFDAVTPVPSTCGPVTIQIVSRRVRDFVATSSTNTRDHGIAIQLARLCIPPDPTGAILQSLDSRQCHHAPHQIHHVAHHDIYESPTARIWPNGACARFGASSVVMGVLSCPRVDLAHRRKITPKSTRRDW